MKFDYTTKTSIGTTLTDVELKGFGNQGWELVSVVNLYGTNNYMYTFKKLIVIGATDWSINPDIWVNEVVTT